MVPGRLLEPVGIVGGVRKRETGRELVVEDPSIGAFLFECSDMPPYSAAVQAATGLPVFDWIGFINYVHHAVVRRPYHGFF